MTESPPTPAAGPASGEPPPLTAFAWRHGLVRPVQGRTFAGVSGALARATNTDPVLWKVILVVLAFFGFIGVLIYLLAWLLLPADGDTATPVEALGGQGHSRTSTPRTIVGLIVAGLMLAGYITEPYRATPLVAMALLVGVLLVLLRDQSRGRAPTATPGETTVPYAPPPPAAPPGPPAAPPFASSPGPTTAPGASPGPTSAPFAAPPGATSAPVGAPPGATTAPFAPQGPFAPPPPVPPVAPPPVAPPPGACWQPPPSRPRSRLGQLTISVAVLVLGGLIAADLVGVSIAPLAYLAAPLAVLGLGLLVGTWLGRARWLIPLGLVLMLLLGAGYAALGDDHWRRDGFGGVALRPQSVEEIPASYRRNVGAIDIDMSDVDFSGRQVDIVLRVNLGVIEIRVPSEVDVTVDATVDVGSAVVFDDSWDGFGAGPREIVDVGPDGAGGGELHITATVNTGSLEIHRDR